MSAFTAAQRVLEAAELLKRNTERVKAIPAKRYRNRMLRELPALASELTEVTCTRLQVRILELSDAYAKGDAEQAKRAFEWITIHLYSLTHEPVSAQRVLS